MRLDRTIKERPKLNIGPYKLYVLESSKYSDEIPITIESLSPVNQKRAHSTYLAAIKTTNSENKNTFIKLCDNFDFALSLAKQFKTFYDATVSQPGLTSPSVLGIMKSPPCVVTEHVRGNSLDVAFLARNLSLNDISSIGDRVGLFLSSYHEKYAKVDELDRLKTDLIDFSLRFKLDVNRVELILDQANISAVCVHQDPKPANFLWDSESSTIVVLDPTHRPYIRFPHYDLAVVLYFPLYSRHLGLTKRLDSYRLRVIDTYCRYSNIKWNPADQALTALCVLEIFEKYERELAFYGLLREHFLKAIISIKRHLLIKKFRLR